MQNKILDFNEIVNDFQKRIEKSQEESELIAMKQILLETWEVNKNKISDEDKTMIFIPLIRKWIDMIDDKLLERRN